MTKINLSQAQIAGRDAADRLAKDWDNRDWVPESPTADWARAAIARLGEIISGQPSMLRASIRGADRGASTLSPRPFQGLVECLQNADDLGASSLRIAYRCVSRPELLIVHDGSPVTLADAGAMLLPWLSTKDADAEAAGRFGIGQRTLSSLGGPIFMHSPPFNFVIADDGPEPCEPESDVEGVYNAARRDTMLVIPLLPTVTCEMVAEAVRELDVEALVFLKSIRRLQFVDLLDRSRDLEFSLNLTPAGTDTISFGKDKATVEISDLRIVATAGVKPTTWWRRYSTRRVVPAGQKRSNKATGETTPISICITMDSSEPLRLYDRMPFPILSGLPIGLNAQFDPDSARSSLQPNKWNAARFGDLAHLVTWSALRAFNNDIASAWNHVPLHGDVLPGDGWSEQKIRELVETCHAELRQRLTIPIGDEKKSLQDLAYEEAELESLLTDQDVENLRPAYVAMPRTARDSRGRWRLVLDELSLSEVVTIADALEVLDDDVVRPTEWYVDFAALAHSHSLSYEFVAHPSILLLDGTVTARPYDGETWVLVKSSSPQAIASRLGLVRQIHPAYLASHSSASGFVSFLEKLGILFDARDSVGDVFTILRRSLSAAANPKKAVRLNDADLLALRDAWAQLPREEQVALGPKIGKCVELKATWIDVSGKRANGWARPAEMYLPASIDRDVDSFAKAAGRTPGLKWADPEYARLLRQETGRSAIGAQRLFTAWGVSREPQLIKPLNEQTFWVRDPTPASPIGRMQTPDQLQAIAAAGQNTYLLKDHWSPDAERVALDIANAPKKKSRKRAVALLATLSRGWERRYSEAAAAFPAYAYNGHWYRSQEVRATWLARLADIKWLPDAAGGLQRPSDLHQQTVTGGLRSGDRARTIAKFDHQIQRSGILPALGVKTGPNQRELISILEDLREQTFTSTVAEEALASYQLLASSLKERNESVPEGRMSSAQLRNAFRADSSGRGLLLIGENWVSPEKVFRGPAVFGSRRAFAPHVEELDPLWKTLGIGLPEPTDAIAILKEIARVLPSAEDLGIAMRALKLLADGVSEMSSQLRATLRRIPLWTGCKWSVERPIYALEGEALLRSASAELNIWRPGMNSFAALAPLLEPLGVVRLTQSDFQAISTPAYGLVEGDTLRPAFCAAVSLLRQELVRADQTLLDSLSVDWEELLVAPVIIDPELSIVAVLQSGKLALPVRAHVERAPLRLMIRDVADAGAAEAAGAAIASLFEGDRQKAAWAWAAVWPRALAGEQANGAVLPKLNVDRGASDRLEKLAKQAISRAAGKKDVGRKAPSANLPVKAPVQVRKLRDLNLLEPSAGVIVNEGTTPIGDLVFSKRRGTKERTFNSGYGERQEAVSQSRGVLPPSSDREAMALEVVRRALQLEIPQLNDLRAARGLGVDAIDELRQCYEIKMNSNAEIPTDVTLTASEVEAARNDPDFFLVIVSGLEEGAGQLRVRFIFEPLATLAVKLRGELTLTGVDKATALEFTFEKARQTS